MFTGIIEAQAKVLEIKNTGSNTDYIFQSAISRELKTDQSVSHNGVCLTVTNVSGDTYSVTAVEETLSKTNLGLLKEGGKVNLERCMLNNGRFDGHIVQGHVDQTAVVTKIENRDGSWLFTFEYDDSIGNVTVEKGSIAVNGVSLTCFNSKHNGFTVAIIPYTFEHTNFNTLREGDIVNLEFDIIGKYVKRLLSTSGK